MTSNTPPTNLAFDLAEAIRYLSESDECLKRLIAETAPFQIDVADAQSPYEVLLESITYQSISGKAAATIFGRIKAMRDLAQKTLDGVVPSHDEALKMSDEELVERLVSVRGIGAWTVEMFLIFRLGRPDVLPLHDLGVKKGWS